MRIRKSPLMWVVIAAVLGSTWFAAPFQSIKSLSSLYGTAPEREERIPKRSHSEAPTINGTADLPNANKLENLQGIELALTASNHSIAEKRGNVSLPAYPRLWIHVDAISEGMANWRIAFIELLLTAKAVGAALVEPCVTRGKVRSCHLLKGDVVRVGHVFDLEKLRREVYPWIVSQEDYEAATVSINPTNIFVFCMHHGNPPDSYSCLRDGKILDNYHDAETNSLLNEALQLSEQTVLNIHTYRKLGFTTTKLRMEDKDTLVNETMVHQVLDQSLVFHSSHYKTVQSFLRQMGIHSNIYNVIHWRAEVPNIDYADCVAKLVNAKNILTDADDIKNSVPTILISSINNDSSLQWGTVSRNAPLNATATLAPLWTNDFLKLDMIKDKPMADMIFLAIWDQLLGEGASKFSTCSKSCRKRNPCSLCNHQGSFGEDVSDLRKKLGKASLTCWPK